MRVDGQREGADGGDDAGGGQARAAVALAVRPADGEESLQRQRRQQPGGEVQEEVDQAGVQLAAPLTGGMQGKLVSYCFILILFYFILF